MSKWGGLFRSALVASLACGLGMLAFEGRAAHAESISITIVANGTTILVDPFVTTGADKQNYGSVDLVALNSALISAGSAYRFSALGGSSNWAGAPSGGTLTLSGEIRIPAGTSGSTSLTITEKEDGFTSPSGVSGTLLSSSTGNYNDAGPGNSHDANSSFNAITTPTYTVASTNTGPDNQGKNTSTPIGAFVTPYSLSNFISFSLTPSSSTPTDGFSVTAKATAVIPEPASMLMMMIGLPLPLVSVAWLRRHLKAVAHA